MQPDGAASVMCPGTVPNLLLRYAAPAHQALWDPPTGLYSLKSDL